MEDFCSRIDIKTVEEAEAYSQLFTPDAVLVAPGSPDVIGRQGRFRTCFRDA